MEKYPTICQLFEEGFGKEIAQSLADGIVFYLQSMAARGDVVVPQDAENVHNLISLMKAILKDCCSVDMY